MKYMKMAAIALMAFCLLYTSSNDRRCQLATRQDIVPDGDLTRDEMLTDTMIDTLVEMCIRDRSTP